MLFLWSIAAAQHRGLTSKCNRQVDPSSKLVLKRNLKEIPDRKNTNKEDFKECNPYPHGEISKLKSSKKKSSSKHFKRVNRVLHTLHYLDVVSDSARPSPTLASIVARSITPFIVVSTSSKKKLIAAHPPSIRIRI